MDTRFENIFNREPSAIRNGDYYYNIPWLPDEPPFKERAEEKGVSEEELRQHWIERCRSMFTKFYTDRDLSVEFSEKSWGFQRFLQSENADIRITDIFRYIAENDIAYADIGSANMGMAPYVLHLNPGAHCLIASDLKPHIGLLSSFIKEIIPENNVSFAAFDEIDIPIKDESLDVVTGVLPLLGVSQNRPVDSNVISLNELTEMCIEKILHEVYRILKPGGYFIFGEFNSRWIWSRELLHSYFKTHDNISSVLTEEEIIKRMNRQTESEKYRLNDDRIKNAGFEISIKDVHATMEVPENNAHWIASNEEYNEGANVFKDGVISLEFYDHLYVLKKPI